MSARICFIFWVLNFDVQANGRAVERVCASALSPIQGGACNRSHLLHSELTSSTFQMIIIASPSKPFVYTAKMTARRQAILKDYDNEINALYDAVEQTSQVDIPSPSEWTPSQSLDYVRRVVHKVMTQKLADGVDIFQHGCDRYVSPQVSMSLFVNIPLQSTVDLYSQFCLAWASRDQARGSEAFGCVLRIRAPQHRAHGDVLKQGGHRSSVCPRG